MGSPGWVSPLPAWVEGRRARHVEPSITTMSGSRLPKSGSIPRYSADLTGGSLKLAESRLIADLLLRRVTPQEWKDAVYVRNVLKAKRPSSAKRLANLIRARLETMGPDLWKLVRDGNATVATHAVLAASVKHSRLLGDFLRLVVSEQVRLCAKTLSYRLWDEFVEGCRERDPHLRAWSDATSKRLRSSVFQTLAQAGYLEDTRALRLQSVHISDEVVRYLMAHHETNVLRCIQVSG
jgi:hypothetical protein